VRRGSQRLGLSSERNVPSLGGYSEANLCHQHCQWCSTFSDCKLVHFGKELTAGGRRQAGILAVHRR